jgi:hypothetical protein
MAVRTHRHEDPLLDPAQEDVTRVESGGLWAVDEKRLVPANSDPPMWVALAAVRLEPVPAPLNQEVGDGGILGLENEALAECASLLRLRLSATKVRRSLAANGSARRRKLGRAGHRKAEDSGGRPTSPRKPNVGRDELHRRGSPGRVGSSIHLSFGRSPTARLRR